MRIFKYGKARCENRFMDEHIQLTEGNTIEFKGEFADDNLNNLSWWTQKHIGYSSREVVDLLDIEFNIIGNASDDKNKAINKQAKNKRLLKHKYVKQPLFWRSFIYFCIRYILRGGFLDGKEGFLWHFLQGWWYRTLVDAKIFEMVPVKKEVKATLSGIYISEVKAVRGQTLVKPTKKKSRYKRFVEKMQEKAGAKPIK